LIEYLEYSVPRVPKMKFRKVGVEKWLVKAVMAMYEGAETETTRDSKAFNVEVG